MHEIDLMSIGSYTELPGGNIALPQGYSSLLTPIIQQIPDELILKQKPIKQIQWRHREDKEDKEGYESDGSDCSVRTVKSVGKMKRPITDLPLFWRFLAVTSSNRWCLTTDDVNGEIQKCLFFFLCRRSGRRCGHLSGHQGALAQFPSGQLHQLKVWKQHNSNRNIMSYDKHTIQKAIVYSLGNRIGLN